MVISLHRALWIIVSLGWLSSHSTDALLTQQALSPPLYRGTYHHVAAVVGSSHLLPHHTIIPSTQRKGSKSCLYSYLALKLDLDELDDEDDTTVATSSTDEGNHLIAAGNYFKGIDENVGKALCQAGIAWSSDWSQVAEALEEASRAFWDVLSKKNISPTLQSICRSVAQELEDISTIEGCSSIGPASSIPNWIAIHRYLEEAAAAYEGATEGKDQMIYEILSKTSREVEQLIECF